MRPTAKGYFSGCGGAYTCEVCAAPFKSINTNPRFCSLKCKGLAQQIPIDFEAAKKLYESGLTQIEVAKFLGVTGKVISNTFKRNGYKSRVAAKRNQWGENNHQWRGDAATYTSLHDRVARAKGKPQHCDVCGTSDSAVIYEWACVGDYTRIEDYTRMCRSCHRKHDEGANNLPNNNRQPTSRSKTLSPLLIRNESHRTI